LGLAPRRALLVSGALNGYAIIALGKSVNFLGGGSGLDALNLFLGRKLSFIGRFLGLFLGVTLGVSGISTVIGLVASGDGATAFVFLDSAVFLGTFLHVIGG
jgi:hypothetical protein